MPKPVALRATRDGLQDLCVEEGLQRRVELLGGKRDRRREQRAVDLLDGRRSRGRDRDRRGRGIEAGHERLVQRRRNRARDRGNLAGCARAIGARADKLLEIERDAAAACRQRESVMLGEAALKGVDELQAAALGEGFQLDRLPRAGLGLTRGEDEQDAAFRLGDRGEQRAGRVVEPVKVLGHDDRRIARRTGKDVCACALGDLFLEPAPFRCHWLIPCAGRDTR